MSIAAKTDKIKYKKEIVEGNKCGICVNPTKPKLIAEAIEYLMLNQKEAQEMGLNGRRAIVSSYNWTKEEEKLLNIYSELLEKIDAKH